MAQREILLPWGSQPQEVVELASGAFPDALLLFNPGTDGLRNLVNGAVGTVVGAPTNGVGADGKSVDIAVGAGLTDGVYWNVASRSGALPWTVLLHIRVDGASALTQGFFQVASTTSKSSNPFILIQRNGTDFRVYAQSGYRVTESAVLAQGTAHRIAVTYDGAVMTVVRNGQIVGTYSTVNMGLSTSDHVWVGNGFNGSAPTGTYFAGYSAAAMPVALLQELTAEGFWQLFAPQSIWVPVSAGGQPPTFNPAWARNSNTVLVGGRL